MRIRTLAATAVLTGLAVLGPAGAAGAHGDTIVFQVTALGDGHTRAVATWANDKDPVAETVAATLSATAEDGRTVGPWRLEPVAGTPGTFTTALALPPGHWAVTVESGFPALGRGEADLTVTAVPGTAPTTAEPVLPITPTPAVAVSAPAPEGSGSGWTTTVELVVAAVAVAAVALLLRRRRAAR